jgi:anthranilate synthase/aminodeoxychorismate synthase-like glutamine amidotransferase
MFILIDNYDSFTWNLVQYFGELGEKVDVYRNDKISADEIIEMSPRAIIISPGPGEPDKAGICLDLVGKAEENNIPLLGVCLGHQTIGQFFGGKIVRASKPMHGKISEVSHNNQGIFKHIPSPINVTRYHSLVIDRDSINDDISVIAETEDGAVMAVEHSNKKIFGIQFHPESIATEHGIDMLKNFVELVN